MKDKIAEETRKIYLKQHKNYIKDKNLFKRFLNMSLNPKYYHLKKDDFKDKIVLDAGCGNSAYLEVALHRLGVNHITCLDLGKDWIPLLTDALKSFGLSESNFSCIEGSTDNLRSFQDQHFDIVFSNGVLPHLVDKTQIEKAFSELARVTNKGGYLYVVCGLPRGLFAEEIDPALRRFYRSNNDFKNLVDDITPQIIEDFFKVIAEGMRLHTGKEFDYRPLLSLFDVDFCTWVQNIIQVPKRQCRILDENFMEEQYTKHGFEQPKRCRRYVDRENIRKFFSPLHYDSSSIYSKVLYGGGVFRIYR